MFVAALPGSKDVYAGCWRKFIACVLILICAFKVLIWITVLYVSWRQCCGPSGSRYQLMWSRRKLSLNLLLFSDSRSTQSTFRRKAEFGRYFARCIAAWTWSCTSTYSFGIPIAWLARRQEYQWFVAKEWTYGLCMHRSWWPLCTHGSGPGLRWNYREYLWTFMQPRIHVQVSHRGRKEFWQVATVNLNLEMPCIFN